MSQPLAKIPTLNQTTKIVTDLIDLWDKHSDRDWEVSAKRMPVNVALVHSSAQQVINLSRGILTLYKAGESWSALPSIRSALECAITAAWYAVAEDKTGGVILTGAQDRRRVLNDAARFFNFDVSAAQVENDDILERYSDQRSAAADNFYVRSSELEMGPAWYSIYRLLSGIVHPGPALADFYLQPDDIPTNPLHASLVSAPIFTADNSHRWLGVHACMMVVAHQSTELVLTKPLHRTQLERAAKRLGLQGLDGIQLTSDPAEKATNAKRQLLVSFMQRTEAKIKSSDWDKAKAAKALRAMADRIDKPL